MSRRVKRYRGQNAAKLSLFMNIPVEIFLEISAELHPRDLLHLSRLSKRFRSVFMSRQTRGVWRAAIANIPGLPKCPPDLNEPQYTSFIFEGYCMACGSSRSQQQSQYGLRLRLCRPCCTANIVKGITFMFDVPEEFWSLLPQAYNINGHSLSNTVYGQYYRPTVETMFNKYCSLVHDHAALRTFAQEQQEIASKMMQHGSELVAWKETYEKYLSQLRRQSIEQRLEDLGWDRQYFPPQSWIRAPSFEDKRQWEKILELPKELTNRRWSAIRPKLEKILCRSKRRRLESEFMEKAQKRYSVFVQYHVNVEDRIGLPSWLMVCLHPSLDEFKEKYCEDPNDREDFWTTTFDAVLAESEPQKAVVRSDLVGLLRTAAPNQFVNIDPNGSQEDLLRRAVSLFSHSGYDDFSRVVPYNVAPHCPAIFPYADMLDELFQRHGSHAWDVNKVICNRDVVRTAISVLEALHISTDAPVTAVSELDGHLGCLCGHPDYREPMTFTRLIRHLVNEDYWYRFMACNMWQRVEDTPDDVTVYNDHDIFDGQSCVTIISPDFANANHALGPTANLVEHSCCTLCWKISRVYTALDTTAEVAYHMIMKHHKYQFEEGEVESWMVLEARYGTFERQRIATAV